MKRIAIIGSGGAGKSTLAKQIGQHLGIEVVHLDALYWKPGWVETPRDKWVEIQQELLKKEEWIVDGNFGSTMDLRIEAADTIIFLDYSKWVCTYRVLKRQIMYRKKTRPDMGANCPEKLDPLFLKWVWNYPIAKRPEVMRKLEGISTKKNVIILKSSREAEDFLRSL
ncbi:MULTISPECIES: DNA topology modulation protein [Bacillaceae]|uniref:DNA topology modulation protein n=1 Tax=Evansella alkalicola TaxID=745819 RepID=A0ABS6JXB0_9BACI|nr:DNA topology modulation protein [Litchfieldia alkalitelluris]MBU9723214.1 DNA topology modulation protein [Bacillus alkalicola]